MYNKSYGFSIMVYAFKHTEKGMECCDRYCLRGYDISCVCLKYVIKKFLTDDPKIEEVYAIDNNKMLKETWKDAYVNSNIAGNDVVARNYEFYNYVASSKESVKLK